MNIFFLDPQPEIAARMHCDKHVCKMIVEYAQMLSTAHHETGSPIAIRVYKPTHKNHPANVWVRSNAMHYHWLYQLWRSLGDEYQTAYNRNHLSIVKLATPLITAPPNLPVKPFEMPPQCMPDEFKASDTVEAYRQFYILGKPFAKWNRPKSEMPEWYRIATEHHDTEATIPA